MQRRPRQLPISCKLCRSMKLKCNREVPCSNCSSRGITCERAHPDTSAQLQRTATPTTSTSDQDEILSLLRRLEDLIIRPHGTAEASPASTETEDASRTTNPSQNPEEEGDSEWLDGVGTREPSVIFGLSNGVALRVVPIQLALQEFLNSTPNLEDPVRNAWLPSKLEALWLLESYAEHVAYLHHVVHVPSVRNLMDNLYEQIRLDLPVSPSHVALVLSIFASTAYMVNPCIGYEGLFSNLQNAIHCAFRWSKAALNVLEHSHHTTSGSLEDIQATIILAFVLFNFEGFTKRFRTLGTSALSTARDLSLHRLDADVPASCVQKDSAIQIEVKRRVWWHLVSTDWLLALTSGPQEGTYLIHPNHMRVSYPRNIDDIAINRYGQGYNPPLSQPTAMTYSLLRIRLAEICRSVVDALPTQFSDRASVKYEKIISLNGQFEQFLHDLPFFFRLDEVSRQQSREIIQKYPMIAIQRYIICCNFHARRFKLNQPFLTRASLDRRYQYSREVCLKSARSVIEIKRMLEHDTIPFASTHFRLATFLHAFYLATAVLVMDLCFEKSEGREEARQAEVMDAIGMLQEAEKNSSTASKFSKSLVIILNKHRICLPKFSGGTALHVVQSATGEFTSQINVNAEMGHTLATSIPMSGSQQDAFQISDPNLNLSSTDEMWQDFVDLDQNSVPASWDNWFSALDAGTMYNVTNEVGQ